MDRVAKNEIFLEINQKSNEFYLQITKITIDFEVRNPFFKPMVRIDVFQIVLVLNSILVFSKITKFGLKLLFF